MDIQRLIKSLKDKGINIVAKANSVTAGLIWGVEGVEKVPKLGEVLFYVVNGTRYGVKPKRGNKHDIDWYYKQLKMGMQGAKAYHTGLTQFLNTWIKKGELEVVFKGKATANAMAAVDLNMEHKKNPIDDEDEDFGKFQDKVENITFFGKKPFQVMKGSRYNEEWVYIGTNKPIHIRGYANTIDEVTKALDKYLEKNADRMEKQILIYNPETERILFNDDENGCSYYMFSRNHINFDKIYEILKKECADIEKITKNVNGAFVEATASASVNEDGIIDKVSLTAIRNYLEQNNIEFDLKQNGRIYTFSFDCGKLILDDNNQKVKAFFDGKVKEAETMRELNDFFSKCKVVASVKLTEGIIDNVLLHELNLNADKKKEGDFTVWTLKAGKRDLANVKLNNITGLTRIETTYGKVLAHTITTDAEFRNVINKLISEKAIAASKLVSEMSIDNLLLHDMNLNADKHSLSNKDITLWDIYEGTRRIAIVRFTEYLGRATVINAVKVKTISNLKTLDEVKNALEKILKNVNSKAVASKDNRDAIIKEFIDKVNNLKVRGMKAFNAFKHSNGISIQLLLPRFKTEDMDKLTSVVEDKLSIIFPITQKWMDADKGRTFGNLAKVGDIVLYTDEWSSQEFSSELVLDFRDSKFDDSDIRGELDALYEQLESDCKELNNPSLKFVVTVTAKTVTVNVKETAEVNEENFEGINEEHDRLMYIKVTPEKFLNLWKTSKNFNGSQIQKIIYGFKLASRTLGSKFENKGILIEYFYSKKYGKGYIRVEYEKDLFIIYVAQSEDNGDIKVITRKMRKMIPTKNFNILSTSVNSLAFERAALPAGFKPVWEEVTQSK